MRYTMPANRRPLFPTATLLVCLALPTLTWAQAPERDRERDGGRQDDRDGSRDQEDWEIGEDGKARPRRQVRVVEPAPGYVGPVEWRLGVVSEDTQVGCLIREVRPGTAAYRAGLERGDYIVAVDGYQVGWVNGRLYDMGNELQVRAGRMGRVRILVQNSRDRSLINLDVELDRVADREAPAEYALVRGSVSFRERIALPSRAVLIIKLVKLPRWGGEPVLLAQRSYSQVGQPPIPFELRYPLSGVERAARYEIQAEISVDGRAWFVNDAPVPCITGGHPTEVQILLKRWN